MPAESPLPKDHPLMVAWELYRATPEYGNAFRWADYGQHREGSMWAAFMAGWLARTGDRQVDRDARATEAEAEKRKGYITAETIFGDRWEITVTNKPAFPEQDPQRVLIVAEPQADSGNEVTHA